LDDEVEVVDDDETILGGGTEKFSIAEVKTDVVNTSNQEAHPVCGGLDESVHELEGSAKIGWEDSTESGDDKGDSNKCK